MLALVAAIALLPQQLKVGTSKVDITPDVSLPLGGYTERGSKVSVPGGDHLYSRCLSFRQGNTKIAIVSVETLTIPESLLREVKKRIPTDVVLFLAATHTHSAPDSQMLNDRMTFAIPGIASYQSKWLTWYADKIASGVKASFVAASSSPNIVGLDIREGHAAVNFGRRKFADPDTTATLLYDEFWAPTDEPTPQFSQSQLLLLQYAAHGTVYGAKEMHTRGDWPGVAAEKFGCEVLQGAIGDVLPKETGSTPQESIETIVRGLAHATLNKQLKGIWKFGDGVSSISVPITLDPVKPHPTMAKAYGVPDMFAESIVEQFAPKSASITAIRLGKLAIVGVPGEPTSSLGRQIRDAGRRMGFDSVLVCSHVNGWMGYILDPDDYDRGGYEATLSFYGRDEGAKVVDAGIQALRQLVNR